MQPEHPDLAVRQRREVVTRAAASCGPVPASRKTDELIDPGPISSCLRLGQLLQQPSLDPRLGRGVPVRGPALRLEEGQCLQHPHPTIRRSTELVSSGLPPILKISGGSRCESLPGPARPGRSRTASRESTLEGKAGTQGTGDLAHDFYGPVLAELQVQIPGFRMTAVGTGVGMTLHHDHVHARAVSGLQGISASTGICFRRNSGP